MSPEEFKNSLMKSEQEKFEQRFNDNEAKHKNVDGKLDDIEQYSRRNNIQLAGIPESHGENR